MTDLETELQAAIDRMASRKKITAADLEQFHRRLPTDPVQAELVSKAFPYPWGELFEYVSGSDRQSAYWRVKPDRSEPRSPAEREARQRFIEAARAAAGRAGTVERDGQEIPATAAAVAEAIDGTGRAADDSETGGGRALDRLRSLAFGRE